MVIMALPVEADILATLRTITPEGEAKDVVALDMVSGLSVKPAPQGVHVAFALAVDPRQAAALEPLRKRAEMAVATMAGVLSASAVLTAHKAAPAPAGAARKVAIEGIRHIIAVASGKGGVGKSTTAVNLAVALAASGLRVGLLDADIYGPSIPRLMGLRDKPEVDAEKKMIPLTRHGVAVMSIGFLVAEESPMIWRGPMVQSALLQMLRGVAWGERDVLVVDMPPGTGDAQLTMAQQVPLAGAVIVSTPQDIALLDARKGIAMFRKVDVPILGLVENMSYFQCPHCGGRSDIFSHGGARSEAAHIQAPFLGEVPLDLAVRETSDAGTPIVAAQPDGPQAAIYRAMARQIRETLEGPAANKRTPPNIIMG